MCCRWQSRRANGRSMRSSPQRSDRRQTPSRVVSQPGEAGTKDGDLAIGRLNCWELDWFGIESGDWRRAPSQSNQTIQSTQFNRPIAKSLRAGARNIVDVPDSHLRRSKSGRETTTLAVSAIWQRRRGQGHRCFRGRNETHCRHAHGKLTPIAPDGSAPRLERDDPRRAIARDVRSRGRAI